MNAIPVDCAVDVGFTKCTTCGMRSGAVELSSLGRCPRCIKVASDAWQARVDAENAQIRAEQARGRRCVDLFGTGHWAHGHPHTPGCVQHVPPLRPRGAPMEDRAFSPANRLRGLAEAVYNAGEGQRNHMLNWAAYKAAEMVVSGELSRDLVSETLVQAGLAAGLTASEVGTGTGRGTVASGLRSGGA